MVIDPFNLHHAIPLFTEYDYIIYISTSIRYQLLPYLPPFIPLKMPWSPRKRPRLRPPTTFSLRLPRTSKLQLNDLLPWMSGILSQTLGINTQWPYLLLSPEILQSLILSTLQLTQLKRLKPFSPTSLKPLRFSFHLSHMSSKPGSFRWNNLSSSLSTLSLPTNHLCLIQKSLMTTIKLLLKIFTVHLQDNQICFFLLLYPSIVGLRSYH